MTVKDLREQRANIWAQAQEFNSRQKAGETMSPEDDAAWTRALDDVDALTVKIERAERNDALETRFRDIDEQTKVVDVRGREGGNVDEYRETFTHYLRYGASRLNAQQQDLLAANDFATRAAAVGTGAATAGQSAPPITPPTPMIATSSPGRMSPALTAEP